MNNPSASSNPRGKTSLELASAYHVCNVIRRQVLDEFPHVTFNFILCKPGEEFETLKQKEQELERHPAGADILTYGSQGPSNAQNPWKLPLLSVRKEKKILAFLANEKILVTCFIPYNLFESVEDVRQYALTQVWHGLSLIDYKKMEQTKFFKNEQGVFALALDEKMLAWHNMLADTFSAVFLELQEHKGSIKALGRNRSLMPLTAKPGWQPECYPYPLALDAAEIVFEELPSFADMQPGKPMHQALEMTREIGETFDLNSMTQWSVFARAAQEMAWGGADKSVILGAAIHTSEDPYVRATAYMIAEFLNIEPVLSVDVSLYNPFSDPETSERHHRKACEDIFLATLSQATLRNDPGLFRQAALRSSETVALGKPIGWCSYGLMCAAQAYGEGHNPIEDARQAFDRANQSIAWQKIQDLNHLIIEARRGGSLLTVNDLAALAAHSDLGFPEGAFLLQ